MCYHCVITLAVECVVLQGFIFLVVLDLLCLSICVKVSAYGFMTPDYKKYSNHYYDSKFQGVAFYANHDFRLEMSLWQELQQAGLLHLYMHQVDRTTVATATT